MWRLVVESGADKGMIFPLDLGETTLGRAAGNTIQLLDKRASRSHVRIRIKSDQASLADLGSRNGTWLNEAPMQGEEILRNGDRIRIGETVLLFETQFPGAGEPDKRSTTVRLIDNLAWGREKSAIKAGFEEVSITADSQQEMAAAVRNPEKRLQLLHQVIDALRSCHQVDPLLKAVMDSLSALLQPDRAFIMLLDEESGNLIQRAARSQEGEEHAEIAISRTIVERCLKERISLLVEDALSDVRFRASESIVIQNIRSAICAPLIFRENILGVIYLDSKSRSSAYGEEELGMATDIANQTSIGLANIRLQSQMIEQRTLEREMEIAKEIQVRLLPREMPKVPNLEFSGMSLAAKKVGGDYYDLLDLGENRIGVALADVSGKGVPAAILIASVRAALQVEGMRKGASVVDTIENLNQMVFRDTASNMFVTMVYGILDASDGGFDYVNAGHPYPLLFAPDGTMAELESGGCFIGISAEADFVKGHTVLRPGAMLVIYSDGVTDTMSETGDLYGRKRLIEIVRANLDRSAQEIRDLIYESTLAFRGKAEQFDDFTVLVIRNTQRP